MYTSTSIHSLILLISTAHAAIVGTPISPSIVAADSGAPYCTTTLGPLPTPPSTVPWGPGHICDGLTGKTPFCCNGQGECRYSVNGKCRDGSGEGFKCCWQFAGPTNLGFGCEDVPKICHSG